MSNFRMLAAMVPLLALPATALAADSTLQLIIGGEAYDGPPKFEVSFDGKVLGEAAVESAIDTATTGRFADAADKSPYVESYGFTIPETAFKPGGEVRVRFLNEAYGGDGSNRDRNLYLASVAVNGRAVTVSGLSTQGTSATADKEMLGEFLVLRDGNVEAVSRAPSGGWPLPGATAAATAPQPVAPAPATPPTPAAAKPAELDKQPVAQLAALRVPDESLPAAVAEEPAAPTSPAPTVGHTAAVAPAPQATSEPTGACDRDELYNVIGFNESSNDLTPKLMARLDQVIADIGNQKCKISITGYSSKQGDNATSALFAIERAQNVLTYLKKNGVGFANAQATGGGATEAFGASPAANRRVVISVSP